MNKQKNLAKNTLILTIGVLVPKLLSIITLPLLTGHLTEDEYGYLDVMSTWITVLVPLITLKLDGALFRMLLESRDNNNLSKRTIANVFYPVAVMTTAWLFALALLLSDTYIQHKMLFLIWLLSQILYDLLLQMLRGFSDNKFYTMMSSLCSVTNSIFIIFFVYLRNGGFVEVLLSSIIGLQVVIVLIVIKYREKIIVPPTFISKGEIRRHLAYSLGLVPNALGNWIVSLSDRLLINYFLSLQYNAIYAVANKLPSLLVMAQSVFATAWTESASLTVNEDDKNAYYSSTFETITDLSAGLTCMALAFTPVFFALFIRGDYEEAIIHNNIIIVGMYSLSITWFLGGIYLAYKDTKQVAKIAIVSAIINVIINVVFIRYIGLFAASLSTTIAYTATMIQRILQSTRRSWIKVDWKRFFIRIALIMVLFALEVISYNWTYNIIAIIISIVFFVVLNKRVMMIFLRRYIIVKREDDGKY